MKKILYTMAAIVLLCMPFYVSADTEGLDPSTISVTPLSATTMYIGDSGNPINSLKIKVNSPGYVLGEDYYLDYVESSNTRISVWPNGNIENNVISLGVWLSEGTDETSNISITIEGRVLPAIPIRVRKISMSSSSVILAKGKSKSLKVKCGSLNLSSQASWKSSNPKVVSVSKTGKVKAKKKGNALITATLGGQKVGCVISSTTKKKISAVKKVIKIVKTCKYSQSRRMSSGYYDCSSLMWKAYRKNGCNFGSSSYAPTAADQAKYMARKKKLLGKCTEKKIKALYYQVGDVCYHSGGNNGRYRNIYHTEMFIGYRFGGFDSNGKPMVSLGSMRSYIGAGDLMARP